MPELARIDGMIITMYREEGGKHHLPHIHIRFEGNKKAVYNLLNGDRITGEELPSNKYKKLLKWLLMNKESLLSKWNVLNPTETI